MKRRQLLPSQLGSCGTGEICVTQMVIPRPGIAGVDLGGSQRVRGNRNCFIGLIIVPVVCLQLFPLDGQSLPRV